MSKNVLILERSSQNLKKIGSQGKTVLEGVFAEFGRENRNGRIYEEKEYLPHLRYLQDDIKGGALLGELDHPERFEVALNNVSHRVTELWYDQTARQIKGRIEILEGLPKGQVAKALLESGVPLSISSRAAGTVNEDKTVQIQQIYTYDLVAKPGFESAQLQTINESAKARIEGLVRKLNESQNQFEKDHHNLTKDLGIINENLSIYDVSDKFPQLKIRPEAAEVKEELSNVKNNSDSIMEKEKEVITDDSIHRWSLHVKDSLSKLDERLKAIENVILEGELTEATKTEVEKLKKYVNKLRSIQEGSIQWQTDIAKAVNKVADYSSTLAKKHNKNVKMTKKLVETNDYNANVLNKTQDWVGHNANVLNAVVETVDHNANMQNGMNEWMGQLAKGVNALNEWGEEKAKAINGMHDWTSSIAKNLNATAAWTEEKISETMSKKDAQKLVEYIELVEAGKSDPKVREKINEVLKNKKIEGKTLSESLSSLTTITEVKPIGSSKPEPISKEGKESGVEFDEATGTIIKKAKNVKVSGDGSSQKPKNLKSNVPIQDNEVLPPVKGDEGKSMKGIMVLNTKNALSKPSVKITGDGPTDKMKKAQHLKLDVKGGEKMNEQKEEKKQNFNKAESISARKSQLNDKLDKIIESIEKEKTAINESKVAFPFIKLLTENEQKEFANLPQSEKEKIGLEIAKHPTNDPKAIKRHWENALKESQIEQPLWLKLAPKKYLELFEKADEKTKAAIEAKSEFFRLETPYQIEDFWQKSGLNPKPLTSLNEVFVAGKNSEIEGVKKFDGFIAQVGEQMKRYSH